VTDARIKGVARRGKPPHEVGRLRSELQEHGVEVPIGTAGVAQNQLGAGPGIGLGDGAGQVR